MKATLITLLAISVLALTGCQTRVAIDPSTNQEQTANYSAGAFFAPLDAPVNDIFMVAIREMDEMGYFRTGELHTDEASTIYARKIGDQKITVRIAVDDRMEPEAQSRVAIRVGAFGDLPESQAIFARIRDAL